ncbi:DnaD domain protein [Caloramator sp. CAR-1]|uniref:DnaD domain protein n=1 Tax=Caloramator sp. CAR-1 TaxID=3062777 RepID=UPI0026E13348|nr:DnaD domain protein [Caloramator sp. CAR-1]MDO6353554.1 DnaD domain protein [Caloramator sp. CAR-1]
MDKFEVQREWHYTIVENHVLKSKLSANAKLLYVILCMYANRDKECFPSYETLLNDTGIKSRATLANAIKELIDKGILEVISGKEEGKSNVYIIKDNPLNWVGCSRNEQGCSIDEQGCSIGEQGGVHEMNRGCSSTEHELKPYNNNQYNYNHITKDDDEKQQQFQKVLDVFNNNIHLMTSIEAQKILDWLDDVEADVIILAIEEAVMNNKRSFNYINKILNTWFSQGLKTKADVEAHIRDWKNKQNSNNTPNHSRNYFNSYGGQRKYDIKELEKLLLARREMQ